ncbi:hypothetical protein E2320_020589 [Naja naja]|nr:hypothetical protein E2320_020589 [Naja naja]
MLSDVEDKVLKNYTAPKHNMLTSVIILYCSQRYFSVFLTKNKEIFFLKKSISECDSLDSRQTLTTPLEMPSLSPWKL